MITAVHRSESGGNSDSMETALGMMHGSSGTVADEQAFADETGGLDGVAAGTGGGDDGGDGDA